MNAQHVLRVKGSTFRSLPGQLDASSADVFISQFHTLFSHQDATLAASVVYFWATEKPIPRLSGSSDIVYIGETVQSLTLRHRKYARHEGGGGNWQRYDHIIKNFGPIRVFYSKERNPKAAEKELLGRYFDEHLELPPLNSRF